MTGPRQPRRIGAALGGAVDRAQPATPLARVQTAWPRAVGERIAEVATPVRERAGVITIACRSGVWAEQLAMLHDDLRDRLGREMGGRESDLKLRFVVAR